MDRRYFLSKLASGLVAAAAPGLFIPKLIKPQWSKVPWSGPRPEPVVVKDLAEPQREMSILMSFRVVSTQDGKEVFQSGGFNAIPPVELGSLPQLPPMTLKYTITPTGVIKTMEPTDEKLLKSAPIKTFSLGKSKWSNREVGVQVQMVNNMNLSEVTEETRRTLAIDLEKAAGL